MKRVLGMKEADDPRTVGSGHDGQVRHQPQGCPFLIQPCPFVRKMEELVVVKRVETAERMF